MAQYTPAVDDYRGGTGGPWFLPAYLVTAVAVIMLLASGGAENYRAMVILLILTPITFRIFARAAQSDPDGGFLYRLLVLAWPAKLTAMGVKLFLAYGIFDRSADAFKYHDVGKDVAAILSSGGLPELTSFSGTRFVELVTGLFYFVTGPTFVGAWIFWSWLATLGMLAHYKAFVTVLPTGHRRLFALLIFFAPTLLMWPNALGKDALTAFSLGLAAYGVARVYRWGLGVREILWVAVGLGGTFLVRPHIGGMVGVALAAAVLLRPIRAGILTPVIRIATFAAMAAVAVVVLRVAATSLAVDLTAEGVADFFEYQGEQSQQGETAFEGVGSIPTTPSAIGLAVLTVFFRPFPWEAGTALALAVALEGVALIALIWYRWRSVLGAIWEARRHAYLTFVALYVLMFTVGFSAISNFGILSRQRAQLLPFVFVLLAYQGRRDQMEPDDAERYGG